MWLGYNDAWRADKKGNVANIWGIGGYMGGSGDNQMLALGQRLLLVKKTGLANIWGGARWTAGRDALARAQKAGGRAEGNTPVSKVLARIGKKRNPVSRVDLFTVPSVVINIEHRLCSVIKSREGGGFMATWVGGKTSFYIRVRLKHI